MAKAVLMLLMTAALGLAGCLPKTPAPPPAEPQPVAPAGGLALFNGRDLAGWRVLDEAFYADRGRVHVADGALRLEAGDPMTGAAWTGDFPRSGYEVELEAMRTGGGDFFAAVTFPVGEGRCSWVVGGWGGTVVGLSSVDGYDASENATTRVMTFESGRWYRLRVRVTGERVECFIDGERVIDQLREGVRFSVRFEMEPIEGFGLSTWRTGAAYRNLRLRPAE